MNVEDLQVRFPSQSFANDYQLVDGVEMHQRHGAQFQIPHDVLKRQLFEGCFVELRIDSPRFSVHEEDAATCACPSCNGEMSKPILRHDHPASLMPLPAQKVPSRGWGEDFWVQIDSRQGQWFTGRVDNPLVETRLHELNLGDEVIFHANHVLAVHPTHRQDLVLRMNALELQELARWLGEQA